MGFPDTRPRRRRASEGIRRMVRETVLTRDDLVYPLFVVPGDKIKQEIPSLPGCFHFSVDMLGEEIKAVTDLGIPAVLLFGIPEHKDPHAAEAWAREGTVQRAVTEVKRVAPEMTVITDVCLCQYTDHGHCGVIVNGAVDNDCSLEILARVALSHAEAGADIVAPSDMMDGRVRAIRALLDANGYTERGIMSYAAKYASAFYGPFRDAAHSAPQFGDRKTYQMDPANAREAMQEVALDIEEGADIVMVKPALVYLDVIHRVRETFTVPVAAYNVSGEYAMIKAAAAKGWIDESSVVREMLTGIKRAGADIIITYFAKNVAAGLR